MNAKKLLINGVGVLIGSGLMYALVKKSGYESQAKTLSSAIVEGSAIAGGVFVGYHLSNLVATYLLPGEATDALPSEQVDALPSGDQPVATPTADTAMGNVKANAAAVQPVTPKVNPADVGGNVIDITKAQIKEN